LFTAIFIGGVMAVIDVWNRFFEGEQVLWSEMTESVGDTEDEWLLWVVGLAIAGDLVDKVYSVEGQKRVLTAKGKGLYDQIKGLYEEGLPDE
jgi:hypothetical protein